MNKTLFHTYLLLYVGRGQACGDGNGFEIDKENPKYFLYIALGANEYKGYAYNCLHALIPIFK